jgi:DNA-binding NarL/FixJ family response regulator
MCLSLESDMQVVGEACNGAEAVEQVRKMHPDVVLMDLDMPVMSGLEATKAVASECAVIILSMGDTCADIRQALDAGARRFICKKNPTALMSTIRELAPRPA